jgi:hypothetical protein
MVCCCMLQVLHDIGEKHGVSASCVADRWVLQQPGVSAIILGARNANHLRVSTLIISPCVYARSISSSSSSRSSSSSSSDPSKDVGAEFVKGCLLGCSPLCAQAVRLCLLPPCAMSASLAVLL